MNMMLCQITPNICPPPCVGCSVVEQKVDRLTEMMFENTRRLLKWEDTVLQFARYSLRWTDMICCWSYIPSCACSFIYSWVCMCSVMEQKVDRLNEVTTENTRRLQKREDTALQYKKCVLVFM